MPLLTIASAIDLIRSSLTLQPNLFQLFQPIGGVSASPPLGAFADWLPCAFATEPIAKKAQTQASTQPHANLFGCFIVSALPRSFAGVSLLQMDSVSPEVHSVGKRLWPRLPRRSAFSSSQAEGMRNSKAACRPV